MKQSSNEVVWQYVFFIEHAPTLLRKRLSIWTRGRETGWGSEFFPLKKWSWKLYPAAQNFTNRMLFWNMHTFETIPSLCKHERAIHGSSIFSRNTANLSTIYKKYLVYFASMLLARAGLDVRDQGNPRIMSWCFLWPRQRVVRIRESP